MTEKDGGPAFSISWIEIVALKKLSLVSHALASKLPFSAKQEQECLATTLDDVIRRYELSEARQSHTKG
jgi:hypothetical protein